MVIAKRASYPQSAISKSIHRKSTKKKSMVGKGAKAAGMTAVLRRLSNTADLRPRESFTRNE